MIIDTHSHLQFDAYDADREEVIKRTLRESIRCINVGVDFASSKKAIELAEKYEDFYAAIGLHPTDADEALDIEAYRNLAASAREKVVAIGEIGLDYFRKPYDAEKQKQVFLQQLDLAKELQVPVIIHCRAAHDDMIEMLKRHEGKIKGVVHCFTGTLKQAKAYMQLGFLLGINGIIFKFNIDNVIKEAPLDYLLVETDCPYLTPPGAPVQRNEPAFTTYVIQKIADLKGLSFSAVAEATTNNARQLFRI